MIPSLIVTLICVSGNKYSSNVCQRHFNWLHIQTVLCILFEDNRVLIVIVSDHHAASEWVVFRLTVFASAQSQLWFSDILNVMQYFKPWRLWAISSVGPIGKWWHFGKYSQIQERIPSMSFYHLGKVLSWKLILCLKLVFIKMWKYSVFCLLSKTLVASHLSVMLQAFIFYPVLALSQIESRVFKLTWRGIVVFTADSCFRNCLDAHSLNVCTFCWWTTFDIQPHSTYHDLCYHWSYLSSLYLCTFYSFSIQNWFCSRNVSFIKY